MSQLATQIHDLCEDSRGSETLRKALSENPIDRACAESKLLGRRHCRMPADVVIWLLTEMALFRKDSTQAAAVFKQRGFTTYGMDCSILTIEDTKKNIADFGKLASQKLKMCAARPQFRSAGLMERSTKLLVDGGLVPLSQSENTAARSLLKHIPGNPITIVDPDYQSRINFKNLHNQNKMAVLLHASRAASSQNELKLRVVVLGC